MLARFLLLEPIDRVLPGQWIKRDRAQILTDSVLSTAPDRDFASSPITDTFDPRSARPAVISVATDMTSGCRLGKSPFTPEAVGRFGRVRGVDRDRAASQSGLAILCRNSSRCDELRELPN